MLLQNHIEYVNFERYLTESNLICLSFPLTTFELYRFLKAIKLYMLCYKTYYTKVLLKQQPCGFLYLCGSSRGYQDSAPFYSVYELS